MKTRITALVLAIALICALLPAILLSASADVILPPDPFDDDPVSGICGENLTWTLDTKTGVLKITGTGATYNFVDVPWSANKNKITTLIIDDGVTKIGRILFQDCINLKDITIGSGVTSIGEYAFENCTSLTSVTIPGAVTHIGSYAFRGCTGLTSLTIGNSIVSIGYAAFGDCNALADVYFLGTMAEWNAVKIDGYNYKLEATIKHFEGSGEEENNTCGENLTWTLDFKTGVMEISGTGPMYGWNDRSDVPWSKYGNIVTSVVIDDEAEDIGMCAFSCCGRLTSIKIGSGVTSIGEHAFEYCSVLTDAEIPDSVISIGAHAFSGCEGLTSLTIGAGVKEIGEFAFCGCKNVTSAAVSNENTVYDSRYDCNAIIETATNTLIAGFKNTVIPDGVTSIGIYAFSTCSSLKSLSIGSGVKSIGNYAFYGCTGLTDVYFHGTKSEWNAIAIGEDNDCLTEAKIHCSDGLLEPAPTFNDVPANAWYYDAMRYAVSNKLMNGVGNNNFAPDAPMTRAMLVTVLWRYEGSPKEGTNGFRDVPAGDWYTDAVAWAAANGIVGGVGNGRFDPNGNITREQMAAILYRYAQRKDLDTSKRGSLSAFPDESKVSSYATDAIAWTVAEGIINGSGGKLLPQGNATRAQVSAILMRFIEGVAKR